MSYFYYHRNIGSSSDDSCCCMQCEAPVNADSMTECGQCQDILCIPCCAEELDCQMCLQKEEEKEEQRGYDASSSSSSSRRTRNKKEPPLPIVPTCCEACQSYCDGCNQSFHSLCLEQHVKLCRRRRRSLVSSSSHNHWNSHRNQTRTRKQWERAVAMIRDKEGEIDQLKTKLDEMTLALRVAEKELEIARETKATAEQILEEEEERRIQTSSSQSYY